MLVFDSFAILFRALIALATVVAVWMSIGSEEVRNCDHEYYAILLASAFGDVPDGGSANLLIGLSRARVREPHVVHPDRIPRHNRRSLEAALKYLIMRVASGTMIYGMSWISDSPARSIHRDKPVAVDAGSSSCADRVHRIGADLDRMGYRFVGAISHVGSDVYTGAPIRSLRFSRSVPRRRALRC